MTERENHIVELFKDGIYMEQIVDRSKREGNRNRICKCTAWFVNDGSYTWIVSYDTVVACYDVVTEILYSFGRYSSTTYQHIRKFRNEYTANYHNTKEVNLGLVDNWDCYNNIYRDNSYYKRQHKA